MRAVLPMCLLSTLWSLTAGATMLWRSDASLDTWDSQQAAAPDRLTIVPSPTGEDKQVLRVALKAGDVTYNQRHQPPVPLGNRSEVVHQAYVNEGYERWYRWHVLFPEGFSVTDGKGGGAVFAQWHHWSAAGEPGSPPVLLSADARELKASIVPALGSQEATILGRVPQKPGQWRDIVLHIVFSSNPSQGLFEWWCDGAPVVSRHVATLFPGYSAYLKMGLYRRPTAVEDNVMYLDNVIEATDRNDVWPEHARR